MSATTNRSDDGKDSHDEDVTDLTRRAADLVDELREILHEMTDRLEALSGDRP